MPRVYRRQHALDAEARRLLRSEEMLSLTHQTYRRTIWDSQDAYVEICLAEITGAAVLFVHHSKIVDALMIGTATAKVIREKTGLTRERVERMLGILVSEEQLTVDQSDLAF